METHNGRYTMVKKFENLLISEIRKVKIERPFGLFLSGGIDSGLLAALTKPDIAITCNFPYGKKYDEFEDSEKVAKHLGLKQEVITITKEDFERDLQYAVRAYKPTTHFSLVPLFLLFKKAGGLGLKTILSAEGPDEYLGGYPTYTFIKHEQELYDVPEHKNYKYALDKYLGTPMERFARVLGKDPNELKPYWNKYDSLLSKMGYTDLKLRGIEEMELALADFWGIKLIYPYMTKKIEDFCFTQIPDNKKIKGFTTKWIERKVAEKYLPKDVVWRKNKMGGPVAPVGKWLGEKNEFSKDKYLKLQNKLWKNQITGIKNIQEYINQ